MIFSLALNHPLGYSILNKGRGTAKPGTTTQGDTMNEIIETARRNFCEALRCGSRNMNVRERFASLLERGDLRRDEEAGRWMLRAANLGEYGERDALCVATWDQYKHCNALVTHDLSSFECWDVTDLISEMRIS